MYDRKTLRSQFTNEAHILSLSSQLAELTRKSREDQAKIRVPPFLLFWINKIK